MLFSISTNLDQQYFHCMHAIIKRMVKPLNDVHSKRRKRAKRGSLDLKETLRENIAYQGLLFEPRWPESLPFWGTGDSEMKKYLPFCTIARECSSVNHLERVVGSLLRTG